MPRLQPRLEFLLFRHGFAERRAALKQSFESVLLASIELRASKKLHRLLEIILLLGNYMSACAANATHVQGFKIDFLTKLHLTRTSDAKRTLLQYVTAFVHDKAPDVADFDITLPSVAPATKVAVDALLAGVCSTSHASKCTALLSENVRFSCDFLSRGFLWTAGKLS